MFTELVMEWMFSFFSEQQPHYIALYEGYHTLQTSSLH